MPVKDTKKEVSQFFKGSFLNSSSSIVPSFYSLHLSAIMSSYHLASSAFFSAPYDDPDPNPKNTQLHLYFNHSGILCGPGLAIKNEDLMYVLKKVWSKFGTVTNVFYHKEYTYAFVTYSSHAEAKAALHCMRDHSFFRMVIAEVKADLNVEDQAILDNVFISRFSTMSCHLGPIPKENSFHAEASSFAC